MTRLLKVSGNYIKTLFKKTNIELNKAAEWFHCNKLIVFKPNKKNAEFYNLTLEKGGEEN